MTFIKFTLWQFHVHIQCIHSHSHPLLFPSHLLTLPPSCKSLLTFMSSNCFVTLFVAMGLELFTETLWAHQWVLPKDNDSPSLRIPQKIVQGGVGSVLWAPSLSMIDSWKVWSCKNSVQATVAAVRSDWAGCVQGFVCIILSLSPSCTIMLGDRTVHIYSSAFTQKAHHLRRL